MAKGSNAKYRINYEAYLPMLKEAVFAVRIPQKFSKTNEKCGTVCGAHSEQRSENVLEIVWLFKI